MHHQEQPTPDGPEPQSVALSLPVPDLLVALSAGWERDTKRLLEAKKEASGEALGSQRFYDQQIEKCRRQYIVDVCLLSLVAGEQPSLSAEDVAARQRAHPPTSEAERQSFYRIGELLLRAGLAANRGRAGESPSSEIQWKLTSRLRELGLLDPR